MQKEYSGCGVIQSLTDIVEQYSVKRIFLVTGKGSYSSSGAEKKLLSIIDGIEVCRFFDFEVNPKVGQAVEGAKLLKLFEPDIVIAIGGGSVIDMAKLVNTLAAHQITDYLHIIEKNKVSHAGKPLVAIPTTAGTGSEATHFAVVYIEEKKYSLTHTYILPDIVILDPEMTFNMPTYVSASSGVDALSQAIESFWSLGATEESRMYASKAITAIWHAIIPAVRDKNKVAMEEMSYAANSAGKAINISKTTAPHAISYPISMCSNIAHGHAVALTLGKFFIINSDIAKSLEKKDVQMVENLTSTMEKIFKLLECKDAEECCKKWYFMMNAVGLEVSFTKLSIDNDEIIESILNNVNYERMINHPVKLCRDIMLSLFN